MRPCASAIPHRRFSAFRAKICCSWTGHSTGPGRGIRASGWLAKLARHGRPAWVASFVLRMFPYDDIARTLAKLGLETERFESATFVQRRFVSLDEMQSTIRAG